jgi:anti-anti-sigma regulatory factor
MEGAFDQSRAWMRAAPAEVSDRQAPGVASAELYADKQLVVLRTTTPPGVRFVGEIDASNSNAVSAALAAAVELEGDVHVDVSSLLFCDISGIRELVAAAQAMAAGRRLLLHGLPALIETVIRVVGWSRLPTLVVCECGSD